MTLTRKHLLAMWCATLAIFLLKCLWILWQPTRQLATTIWIIDDTFIGMRVARNVALGLGFSFDGIHPTTGSPFLWTYVTAVPHLLFSKEGAIKATFMLSTFFGALSSAMTFLIAKKVTSRTGVAWTAFALSLFNATAFLNAMNGMDTGMFTFFILLSVASFLNVGRPHHYPMWAWGSLTGLWIGIATLIRADGIFLLIPLMIVEAARFLLLTNKSERRAVFARTMGMVVVAGVLIGAYLMWNYVRSGDFSPANQVGRREISLALHGFQDGGRSIIDYLKVVVWNIFQLESIFTIATGSTALVLLAAFHGFLRKEMRVFTLVSVLYIAFFFGMLAGYQWYFPDFHGLRYINPTLHLGIILVAALFWSLPDHKFKAWVIALMTALLLVISNYLHYQLASRMPWGANESYTAHASEAELKEHWAIVDWMKENLPKGTVVGVRDHGRIALFTDLPIQDLASNLDPTIAGHIKHGTLVAYLKDRNVEYLVLPTDPKSRGDLLYTVIFRDFVFTPLLSAPHTNDRTLYKIDWKKTLEKAPRS